MNADENRRRVLLKGQKVEGLSGADQPGVSLSRLRIENPLSDDSAKFLRRWAASVGDEFRRSMHRRRFFQFYQPQKEEQVNG